MKRAICFLIAIIVIMMSLIVPASAIMPVSNSYILDEDERLSVPTLFENKAVITEFTGTEQKKLNDPQDIFYDKKGFYYVADTGNNRVLKLDKNFKVLGEITEADGTSLSSPTGVSADEYGDVYIADSGNGRIIHLDKAFQYVESFIKPESDLLYDVEYFSPSKVAFDPVSSFIYVIQGKQFMTIDALNNFKGYIGDNKVGFDLWDYIYRKFATEKQKMQMVKREPESYANFCLADDGRLYAVGLAEQQRISVINTVGSNIYPSGDYGETIYDANGKATTPIFTDIGVNSSGIIFVSEQNTGCIYQYDSEGNLLGVFGGKGTGKNVFQVISSIVIGENDKLVTLDSSLCRIQVFEPTDFTDTIHKAISLFDDGKYDEAYELWVSVRKKNSNYTLARQMIGKIEYKNGEYESAKKEFYQGEDQVNYGKTFEKLRYNLFQEHFGLVVGAVALILAIVIILIKLSRNFIKKLRQQLWGGKGVH
ncbi:MAG: hypothetical protein J6D52_03925 [Clostridia bacterium]|nr:hypothetical protein [Clostridia bacterium]